jgi:hypothetical protein
MVALLSSCIAYGAKYARPFGDDPEDREEKVLSHHEIRIKEKDGKTDRRIGYIKKCLAQKPGSPKNEGHLFWRIIDDSLNVIGRVEYDGRFFRYTSDCEYEYIGTWELNPGLKNFFNLSHHTNLYFSGVNPYRDD